MQWRGRRGSENIEDVRGGGSRRMAAKGGIGTLLLAFILWAVFGINPMQILNLTGGGLQNDQAQSQPLSVQDAQDKAFVSVILADTEDVWTPIFAEYGKQYQAPTLVLFSDSVHSACGSASSASGPFYCPGDARVYLDTAFFRDMRHQLGISSEQQNSGEAATEQAGDFAQAYVIAHEVGHHVQNLLGIADQIASAKQSASPNDANALSVMQELQADCFAGVWANRNEQRVNFLQAGDVEEAIDAATQIGDDRLQKRAQGYVIPESFTHGSSTQRVHWFKVGLQSGKASDCDTYQVSTS